MNKQISLYLDFLRGLAAFFVMTGHLVHNELISDRLSFRDFGQTAVILFFVLSGYVISFVAERDVFFKTYAINRISRLWSGVIPAIAITLILDSIGNFLNPSLYENFIANDHLVLRSAINLFFLQGIHGHAFRLSTNGAFWSLSHEFWYYFIFGLWIFLKNFKLKLFLSIIFFFFIGKYISFLFGIWLLGVIVHNAHKKVFIPSFFAAAGYLTSLILIYFFIYHHNSPLLENHYIYRYTVGVIFSLNIFFFKYIDFKTCIHVSFKKIIRGFAFFLLQFICSISLYTDFS